MDTEFECASCGDKFTQAAFAVVIMPPDNFNRIFIFCSKECYRVPFHQALGCLTPDQRSSLKNITIWFWDDQGSGGNHFSDAESLFKIFERARSLYEKLLAEEADDRGVLEFEEEKNDPVYDSQARRLKRMLLSRKPESSYPRSFEVLYHLLGGPLPEGPEKLE